MKKLMMALSFVMAVGPVSVTFCESKKEKEENKGVAGVINRTSDMILGTLMIIGAMIVGPKALTALKEANTATDNGAWFLETKNLKGLFDSKIDPVENKLISAVGLTGAFLALAGFGMNKVLRATGLKEE